jgi:hypothetical protein
MWSSFVANRQTAWLLYTEAKTWGTTPASLLNIEDPYIAFCLNQAVGYWGMTIESALDEVDGKNSKEIAIKRKAVLRKWLYPDSADKPQPGQFADPALMFS